MEDATLSPTSDEAYGALHVPHHVQQAQDHRRVEELASLRDKSCHERKQKGGTGSGSILKVPSKHYGTKTHAPRRSISFAEGTKTLSPGTDDDEDEIAVVSGRRGCCILQ